ncbi:MAG: hypothetical protein ABSB33_05375 [Tepidisphaeraceae bacterium]|jgi:hypothetical protein
MPTKRSNKYRGRCFVMQPFDGKKFDRRFKDIFEPAIKAAGMEPYRVDRDPSVDIPIAQIEKGIGESLACFAEITTDNPNVWYELGYATASGKPTCLVCSTERKTDFPFDVRHRGIIKYDVGSPSDFHRLRRQITSRLKAVLARDTELARELQGTWMSSWPPATENPSDWLDETVEIESRSGELVLTNSNNNDGYQWEGRGKLHEHVHFYGTFRSVKTGANATGVISFYVLPQGEATVGFALCCDSNGKTIYSSWAMGRSKASLGKAKSWISENSGLLGVAKARTRKTHGR